MSELARSLEDLAGLLEASKPKRRVLLVAAFSAFDKRGKPINPTAIHEGDQLYLQRPAEFGAGQLRAAGPHDQAASTNAGWAQLQSGPGRLYGTALESLAAGKLSEMAVGLYEKRWETDGDPCPICQENEDAGWILADEAFPSGDDEPLAHPNCYCSLEMRRAEEE